MLFWKKRFRREATTPIQSPTFRSEVPISGGFDSLIMLGNS